MTKIEQASAWLKEYIGNRVVKAGDVFRASEFRTTTLKVAYKRLGGMTHKFGLPAISYWRLSSEDDCSCNGCSRRRVQGDIPEEKTASQEPSSQEQII
ncbi:MAG: hypothetical protein DMG96_01595 [Acidobacteria bacterium]|nr:MAG: hypothetical protein DMG96_01595 [Acidobacteriota bacterium]